MGLIPNGVSADTPCVNCGRDFADHTYVKDSLSTYVCPVKQSESCYGFYTGGDPRKFFPDQEDCTPTEIENHRTACRLWDEAEARGETPEPDKCPSGFVFDDDGKCVGHVLRAPYGIGMQLYEFETEFEALELEEDE